MPPKRAPQSQFTVAVKEFCAQHCELKTTNRNFLSDLPSRYWREHLDSPKHIANTQLQEAEWKKILYHERQQLQLQLEWEQQQLQLPLQQMEQQQLQQMEVDDGFMWPSPSPVSPMETLARPPQEVYERSLIPFHPC